MAIQTFARKELKFLLTAEQFQAIRSLLDRYMQPDPFCVDGKEYGIYNVYYDTPDDYMIRESLSKPYYKEKLRLRSYLSPAQPGDTVFLEIKKKIGGIVNKRRVTMTLEEAEAYMQHGIRPDFGGKYIQEQVMDEIDMLCARYAPLLPKEYISYQRAAFFGKDNPDFRLTFDRALTGRRSEVTLSQQSYGDLLIPEDCRLMEVKIAESMPMWLAEELAAFQIYKTSFSKYGRAYEMYVQNQLAWNRPQLQLEKRRRYDYA
ncbi:polyphosphate polymerase domain-containing protein [Ruminococcus sp.]|uniref:polyphosphate polymerase domain-containing protein n=1 Tax=Ruminococcus sp. TaxID=41978 RepID=UPI0026164972|nr:polyphosphate polymerase domain-containing protein [Ruminococcus sp.]MEE0023780.1 polyphosphate polymerase domain-containing protein [Ruminococcus sp.]